MDTEYNAQAETQSLSSLIHDLLDEKIDLKPPYQRDVIWNTKKRSYFIDSCMKGIIPQPIIINVDKDGKKICIDGKQRLTSILNFYKNEIPWITEDDAKYYYTEKPEKQDTVEKMTNKMKNHFENMPLHIIKYKNLTYGQQVELFSRIQHGVKASKGELMVSEFKNDSCCKIFRKECDAIIVNVKKFTQIKCDRGGHYTFYAKLMYLIDNNKIMSMTENAVDKYINNELSDLKKLKECLKTLNDAVIHIFTDNIFNNDEISSKLRTNILLATSYTLYKKHNKSWKTLDSKMCQKAIDAINKVDKDAEIKKEYTSLKEDDMKAIINKFEKYLNGVDNKKDNISDDSSDSDSDSSSDSDYVKPKKVIRTPAKKN
jgi:hypothetical protein